MACIVYQVDKRTGIKYAYSSESYWDKDKKQPRSKRTFLGKVDPITGDIIPKKTREPSLSKSMDETTSGAAAIGLLKKELHEKDQIISDLRNELRVLSKKHEAAQKALSKINNITFTFLEE